MNTRPDFPDQAIPHDSHMFTNPINHVYGTGGQHRLEINGRVSVWRCYSDIAVLKCKRDDRPNIEVIIAATTEFWWPDLPEIFEILPISRHQVVD